MPVEVSMGESVPYGLAGSQMFLFLARPDTNKRVLWQQRFYGRITVSVGMIVDQNSDYRRINLVNKGREALLEGGCEYGGHSRKNRKKEGGEQE